MPHTPLLLLFFSSDRACLHQTARWPRVLHTDSNNGGWEKGTALSLLFRNAVEIMKVLSVKRDDYDFHMHDKMGCDDQRAPSLKMLSSLIFVWNSSHSILV